MKTQLYNKASFYNFEKLFAEKGYAYFTKGSYNLNIIGIRSNNNNKVTNLFDDLLVVIYKADDQHYKRQIFPITTEPGIYYMYKPYNPAGSAILVPGQYRGAWKIGKHRNKYDALVQAKPIKVYRDNNRDKIYDMKPITIKSGMFGINIHRSSEYSKPQFVNTYSAGCQVFQDRSHFDSFMRLCKLQQKLYGNSFTYTLINEEDLV